jgi:hypothetical protein
LTRRVVSTLAAALSIWFVNFSGLILQVSSYTTPQVQI